MAPPPLHCIDDTGQAVLLPFSDGCYTVPDDQALTLLDTTPELPGPLVFGPDSSLRASVPDQRATLLHDGPAVIRRSYLGEPAERASNALAATVSELRLGGGGRGECVLPLVHLVA